MEVQLCGCSLDPHKPRVIGHDSQMAQNIHIHVHSTLYLFHGRQAVEVVLFSRDDAGNHQLPDHQDFPVDQYCGMTDGVQPRRAGGRLSERGGEQD